MGIIQTLALLKLISSGLFVFQIVHCSQFEDHDGHPLMTVFRQFFDERKHARHLGTFGTGYNFTQTCHISPETIKEIAGYNETIHKILNTAIRDEFQGTSYKALSLFVDLFPNRIPGSDILDEAITFLEEQMYQSGLDDLVEEESEIVTWSRGVEIAWVTNPIEIQLNVRGLSLTVGTPEEGIEAEVLLVRSFADLELHHEDNDINGTIVFFNSVTGDAHMHLLYGPTAAAKYGALAVLCRSPTKYIYSSAVLYDSNVTKIPAVVVSREDADKLERMIYKEEEVYVFLKMIGQVESNETSRNIIGDYQYQPNDNDTKHKYQNLMLVSHVGSGDLGDGAQDDGLGIVLALQITRLLNFLELRPKRSIRTAIFSGEETGLKGATKWVHDHANETNNITAVMEADMGCFKAAGFFVSGTNEFACVVREIMGLFRNQTNSTLLAKMEAIPSNVMPIHGVGVPWIGLIGDNNKLAYWDTKRSALDSVAELDSDEMDKCLGIMASVAYVLADMEKMMTRK